MCFAGNSPNSLKSQSSVHLSSAGDFVHFLGYRTCCIPRLSVRRGRGVLVRRSPRDRLSPSISGSSRYRAQVLAIAPVGSEPDCRVPIRGFKSFTLERFGDNPLGLGCGGGLHVDPPVIRNIGGDDHGKLLRGFLLSAIELRGWVYATAIGVLFHVHLG